MSQEASQVQDFEEQKVELYMVASSLCRTTSLRKFKDLLRDLIEDYIPATRDFLQSKLHNYPSFKVAHDDTSPLEDTQNVCFQFMKYILVRLKKLEEFADQLLSALNDDNDEDTEMYLLHKLASQKPRRAVLAPQEVFNNVLATMDDKDEEEEKYCAMWFVLDRIEIYIEEMWKKFYQVAEKPGSLELIDLQL